MIENEWEFLYFWGTQGLIILLSIGFGMIYERLRKKEAGK